MKRNELLFGVIICLHLKIKSSAVLLDDQISSQALIQILENSWRACITNSRQDNLRDNSSSEPKTEIYTYAMPILALVVELLSHSAGSEFHITDEELVECCNEVEVMMKEVNNIDAPEGARGDNKKKTIVDIIFEDFSTTPFNSPTASPESKLRNLERSPLFILREKPKRNYCREVREKAKSNLEEKFKAAIDDNSISERDRGYIEKEGTYNVNETLVPPNQSKNRRKTGISENWDEDDNDVFASIILDQNEKISKFQKNKQIIQGFQTANGKKISISEESKMSIQNILREFQDDLQKTDYETELKNIKVRISYGIQN
ncbi:hypothetical protein GQX74_009304 [Glossina fuscipes]|nr:hypothetical protein GQX74_009304 [Glossina fuscipes]